jgi:hypothetical protein
MAQRLSRLEVDCDAPSYSVVRACRHAGFQAPEDVRWQRLPVAPHSDALLFGLLRILQELSGLGDDDFPCWCGQILPRRKRYLFRLNPTTKRGFLLAQCGRCRTMFWDEFEP